jgi:hypothetical protein
VTSGFGREQFLDDIALLGGLARAAWETVLEFLARVIMHIPEPRRYLVRYYGWHSNVSRDRRGKEEAEGFTHELLVRLSQRRV